MPAVPACDGCARSRDGHEVKINAIIDWEYAGFYPKEGAFYKRVGISMAIEGKNGEAGEPDDVPVLMKIISECVVRRT